MSVSCFRQFSLFFYLVNFQPSTWVLCVILDFYLFSWFLFSLYISGVYFTLLFLVFTLFTAVCFLALWWFLSTIYDLPISTFILTPSGILAFAPVYAPLCCFYLLISGWNNFAILFLFKSCVWCSLANPDLCTIKSCQPTIIVWYVQCYKKGNNQIIITHYYGSSYYVQNLIITKMSFLRESLYCTSTCIAMHILAWLRAPSVT